MSPFYPRLPDPQYTDPVAAGVTGLGVGLAVGNRALQSQMYGEALAEQRDKRKALQEYAQTGDEKVLYPYLTPEQAISRPAKLSAEQIVTATKAMDYWDTVRPYMTMETYPKIRSQAMQTFPELAKANFPDPSEFKSQEDFNKWLFTKERMAADFKRMGLAPKISGGYAYDPASGQITELPMTAYQKARLGEMETRTDIMQQRADTAERRAAGKGKDYTAKLADYDVKEVDRADKITAKFNKQINELPRDKNFPIEKNRLLKERDAALKANKETFDAARKKLGAPASPRKALKDMSTEELRAAIARMKGQSAPAAAVPAGGEEEDEEED